MWEGSCGNSQNLRNFSHTSLGGWWARNPSCVLVVSSDVFIGVYLGPSVQSIPPVFPTRPPFGQCWNRLRSVRLSAFVCMALNHLMSGSDINSKFFFSENVLLNSWNNLFVCALFYFCLRSHALCCRLNPSKLFLKDVCGTTCQSSRVVCGNAPLSTLSGASKLQTSFVSVSSAQSLISLRTRLWRAFRQS